MFSIDDNFVNDLGLGALPQDEKREFEAHIRNELQMRVGESLTSGMSEESLDEFGYFVDGDEAGMTSWLDKNLPGYADSDEYKALRRNNSAAPEAALMSEYGSLKWLQINRPDYPQVVKQTLQDIRDEIIANRDAILSGVNTQ